MPDTDTNTKTAPSIRESLKTFYLDYINDFLTIRGVASYYGISADAAQKLIETGRNFHEADAALLKYSQNHELDPFELCSKFPGAQEELRARGL